MTAKELLDRLNELVSRNNRSERLDEFRVGIKTVKLNSVGGTYLTDIKSINFGFDWDNNKLIITPEKELREVNLDEVGSMRDELSKIGWTAYQFNSLKRENKKLIAKIKELEEKLSET